MNIYGHLLSETQAEAARVMDEVVTSVAVELAAKFATPKEP